MPTLYELHMGINPLLALKLFMQTSHEKLREMTPQLMAEARHRPPQYRGFDDGVYDHTHYRTVYNLVTNKEKRGYKDFLNRAMEAFVTLKLLQNGGRYFRDSERKPFRPSEEDLIFTGSLLMHHMMNFACNSAGIFEIEVRLCLFLIFVNCKVWGYRSFCVWPQFSLNLFGSKASGSEPLPWTRGK